jgi:hypothetical protein
VPLVHSSHIAGGSAEPRTRPRRNSKHTEQQLSRALQQLYCEASSIGTRLELSDRLCALPPYLHDDHWLRSITNQRIQVA